jgi:hypothetical protein
MPAAGNPCPIKGCTAHAKPNQLMCWPHWRRVPKALNHAVFDTFRAWESARRRDPGGRIMSEVTAAYRQARDAAVAAVEAKEADEVRS